MQTPEREYEAQLAGSFEKMQDTPSPKILTIKEGALVVFNKNNYPDYINGTSGIVEKLEDRYIVVRCLQDNKFITVRREEWKSFAYDINEETGDGSNDYDSNNNYGNYDCFLGFFTYFLLLQ